MTSGGAAAELERLRQENERLRQELDGARQQQTATSEVLRSISRSAFDLDTVLGTLVKSAAELCHAAHGIIALRDGDSYRMAQLVGFTPEFAEYLRAHPVRAGRGTVTGRVAQTAAVVHVPDVLDDPDYDRPEGQKIGQYRTSLGVPLLRNGEVMGVFTLARLAVEPFGQREIELVQTFADQAVIAIENARLFEEVQARNRDLTEALEQQTATGTILRAIAASPTDIQPVLDTVVESAARLCEAFDALIFLKSGDDLVLKAHYGPLLITFPQAPISRDWVTGRAFLDRKTIQVEDLREVAEEYPLGYATGMRAGFRTVMAVPLLREGEAIGAIAIRRREVAPFTQKQINLVTTFADQAVIAIENARLFEEVQRRNRELRVALEQQTATSDLLKVIGRSTFDLQPVFDALAESAVRLCEAERAFVFRFDGELLRAVAWHNPSPELLAFVTAHPIRLGRETIAARAGLERKTVHVHDVQADPERTYATRDIDPIRTVLAVPMLRGDELLGVTVIYRVEVRPFATSHIALMETFSDQAVIAIENVRLFEEVQARTAELARSVGELKALGEVSQAVNSTLDSKIVLETIVAKAVQLSETHGGAIYVYDASSKAFSLRATYGMDEALIAAIASRPMTINDVGIGDAARQRRPIQMPDLENEKLSPAADIVLKAGFRAVLIVPLLSGDDIAGALVVRRRSTGEFPQATVDLMQTFAAQSAQAIQNARLFSEIEEKSRELEIASRHKSQFLANMSHELRTPLNSVLGFTEMLVDGLYGDLPEKAKTTLGRVQANGRHLLGLINDVLDLSKIEAGQLKLAIDDYIVGQIVKTVEAATEPLARNKGLVLSVDIAAGLPRGRGDERRLTQVLLNLAGNAVKFTDKGSIAISARAANGCFEFLVKDTGPGIAPEHQSRIFEEFQQVDDSNTRQKGGSGLGLAISRRIVELHGGKIGVESEPGRGSTFRVEIPINAGEAMKGS